MKVFLVIFALLVTGAINSVHAGDGDDGGEKAEGVLGAVADFVGSFFGDDGDGDKTNNAGKGNNSGKAKGKGKGKGKGVNSGRPVPVMEDNDSSAEFIAARIAADTGWAKDEMIPYSKRLAKTLSQLSAREQAIVFYGSH